MSVLPYSYHTFLYPFVYDKDNQFILDLIEKKQGTTVWEREPAIDRKNGPLIPCEKDNKYVVTDDDLLRYAEYHYFMPAAQELLFNIQHSSNLAKDNSILYFNKLVKEPKGKANYIIKIKDKDYILNVDAIRLSLYPQMNIGILSLELENYANDSIEDIIKINEYGRRVFNPVIIESKLEKKFDGLVGIIVPSEISISFDDGKGIKNSFVEQSSEELGKPQDFVKEILVFGHKHPENTEAGTVSETGEELIGKITPAIDDRMYVVSLIRKNDYKPINKKNLYPYQTKYMYQIPGSNAAKELYGLIYLESGDLSCQNPVMVQDKLKDHVYGRWIDWGTIHGITEYSLVCLTGEDKNLEKTVINPFLTEYVDMVKLALLQRTIIINLEHEASKISEKISCDEDQDNNLEDLVKESQKLWRKYIKFQNEFYMPEVTFQEQGVEMYDILKKSLRLEKLNGYLEDELNDFHALTEMQADEQRETLNVAINLIAVVGTTVAIVSMAQDYLADVKPTGVLGGPCYWAGFSLLLLLNVIIISRLSKTNNSSHTECKNESWISIIQKLIHKRASKWIILSICWLLLLLLVSCMMKDIVSDKQDNKIAYENVEDSSIERESN